MAINLSFLITAKDQASRVLRGVAKTAKGTLAPFKNLGTALSTGVVAVGFAKFVSASQIQEQAIASLGASLKQVGVNYDDVAEDIKNTTSALQDKTIFGDEAQIQAINTLVLATQDYDKSINALPALLDFASATQMDLNSAARLFGRALEGDITALTRYSPLVKKLNDEGASAEVVMRAFTKSIEGQAEAVGKVSPLIQFRNLLGDVAEEVGKSLTPIMTALLNVLKGINPNILKVVASLGLIAAAIPLITAAFKALLVLGLAARLNPIGLALTGIALAAVAVTAAVKLFNKESDKSKQTTEDLNKALEENTKKIEALTESRKKSFTQVKQSIDQGKLSLAQGAQGIALIDSTDESEKEFTNTLNGLLEIDKKLTDQLKERTIVSKNLNTVTEKSKKLTDEQKKALEEQAAVLQKIAQDAVSRIKQEEEAGQGILDLQLEIAEKQLLNLAKNNEERIKLQIEALDQRLSIEQEGSLKFLEFTSQRIDLEKSLEDTRVTNNLDANKKISDNAIKLSRVLAGTLGATFAELIKSTDDFGKNLSNIILNLIPVLLATFGGPGGVIAGAFLSPVLGALTNLQTVPGQSRIVPGSPFQTMPALLHGGEVISRGGGGGGATVIIQGDVFNSEETLSGISEGLRTLERNTGRRATL